MYQINFSKLITWFLPKILNRNIIFNLLEIIIYPLISVFQSFLSYKNQTEYWLNINGQVCFLEKALNDHFDFSERRIKIKNSGFVYATIIHTDEFNLPIYTGTEGNLSGITVPVLHDESNYGTDNFDFIVQIPTILNLNQDKIIFLKSILNSNKLASKRYQLLFI